MKRTISTSASSNNKTSDCPGVDWHDQSGKYRVSVTIRGKRLHCGSFVSKAEAIEVSKLVRHKIIDGASYEQIKELVEPYRILSRQNPYSGVCKNKLSGKWVAAFTHMGQYYYCQTWGTKKEAQQAVFAKRKEIGIIFEE